MSCGNGKSRGRLPRGARCGTHEHMYVCVSNTMIDCHATPLPDREAAMSERCVGAVICLFAVCTDASEILKKKGKKTTYMPKIA